MFGGSSFLPGGNPYPHPPQSGNFKPVHVETVRAVSDAVDKFFGNNDGALDAQECKQTSNVLRGYSQNLSNLYGQLANALQGGNPYVDPNGDGKLDFKKQTPFYPLLNTEDSGNSDAQFPGFARTDELTRLAHRTGNPSFVEPSDIRRAAPPIFYLNGASGAPDGSAWQNNNDGSSDSYF